MIIRPLRLAPGGAALLLACFVAAACGGTAPTIPGVPTAQPAAPGHSPGAALAPAPALPSTGAASSQSGAVPDLCTLVTVADVEALYPGTTITASKPPTPDSANFTACSYAFQPEEEGFNIEVVAGDTAELYWNANIPPQGDYNIPVSGIGSQAMRGPGNADLASISGSTYCEMEVDTSAPEFFAGLATPDANDTVSDAAVTAIAQKLGALCNKVFATL